MNDERLVNIEAFIPGIRLDIRYATANNLTKRPLYPVARCYLRKQVAEHLTKVQQELQVQGLGLKVFDCYRPLSIQKQLWALLPDERYVIDPRKGSRHNRGAAVDVTLVDAKGNELEMPTAYDNFSERAHRDYRLLPPSTLRNRELLERIMTHHGFQGLATEWWHFDAEGWEHYPVLDQPFELLENKPEAEPTETGGDQEETTMDYRARIVRDRRICGGELVIQGTRVPLRTVLASLAEGDSIESILEDFPTLTEEDVRAVIAFAAASAEEDLPVPEIPHVA